MYSNAEAYSGDCQASKMNLFAKVVNSFNSLMPGGNKKVTHT